MQAHGGRSANALLAGPENAPITITDVPDEPIPVRPPLPPAFIRASDEIVALLGAVDSLGQITL
jgi:hypothetical protein